MIQVLNSSAYFINPSCHLHLYKNKQLTICSNIWPSDWTDIYHHGMCTIYSRLCQSVYFDVFTFFVNCVIRKGSVIYFIGELHRATCMNIGSLKC